MDTLIIGQGVAGSFLAWELLKQKQKILIVDDFHKRSSSLISAGIINPVTGKRLALMPDFDMFYSCAVEVYRDLERVFDKKFFQEKSILRFLKNEPERRKYDLKKTAGTLENYLKEYFPPDTFKEHLQDPLGSVRISNAAVVATVQLMNTLTDHFSERKILSRKKIEYQELRIQPHEIAYDGMTFKQVIFCEGFQAQYNPWFNWLPFNNVKGEILEIKMDRANLPNEILNKGKWCVPGSGGNWAAGATYIWDDLNCEPTQQGRDEILDGLKYIHREKTVIKHKAAVRPVMKDQQPVIGMHPRHTNMGIFNGLGSKGFLVAPYYARNLCAYLMGKAQIAPKVNINRFNHEFPAD